MRPTMRLRPGLAVRRIPCGLVRAGGAGCGERDGMTREQKAHLKALQRDVRELRRANEILRKASAYFAQAELDRPLRQ